MKNDDIKETILIAAEREFSEKGYQDASMRNIAERAKLTTGSLYTRFKNKEELFFEIVGEAASKLYDLYSNTHKEFFALSAEKQKENLHTFPSLVIDKIIGIIYENFKEFKLIICRSAGSVYEKYIESLIDIETESTYRFIKIMNENGCKIQTINDELVHILASAFFNGFFQIIWHDMKKQDAKNYIASLVDFFNAGWDRILGI